MNTKDIKVGARVRVQGLRYFGAILRDDGIVLEPWTRLSRSSLLVVERTTPFGRVLVRTTGTTKRWAWVNADSLDDAESLWDGVRHTLEGRQ